jgi:phosphopantothenoylcysteine decarboxylase/phosphopantothenate--cysteine ligase
MTLELEPTEDILAEIGASKGERILVGFAAETELLADRARSKLRSKNLDLIVANDVSDPTIGFDSDENAVTILGRNEFERRLPRLPKSVVAQEILDEVVRLRVNGKE